MNIQPTGYTKNHLINDTGPSMHMSANDELSIKKRREDLTRRPSYRKIFNDLTALRGPLDPAPPTLVVGQLAPPPASSRHSPLGAPSTATALVSGASIAPGAANAVKDEVGGAAADGGGGGGGGGGIGTGGITAASSTIQHSPQSMPAPVSALSATNDFPTPTHLAQQQLQQQHSNQHHHLSANHLQQQHQHQHQQSHPHPHHQLQHHHLQQQQQQQLHQHQPQQPSQGLQGHHQHHLAQQQHHHPLAQQQEQHHHQQQLHQQPQIHHIQTTTTTTPTTISPPPTGGVEEVSKKRELRLQKNREAAKECRRKKKEYIKCLENRVAVLENQNKALIDELKTLKDLYCKSTTE